MKTEGKFAKLALLAIMGSLLLSLGTLAMAESDAARAIRASAANVPTNIPGIYAYAAPPKGFNPLTATEVELATYGFPPRPDKQVAPDQYAQWERAMKRAKIRWNGELKPLPGGGHGMIPSGSSALPAALQPETSGPKQILTVNASGVIVASGQKKFTKNSINVAGAEIVVPTVQGPFDTTSCPADGYVISAVGIDGYFDNGDAYDPALEAGVGEVAPCTGSNYYAAIVGWQSSYVAAFDVNPGDVVYAEAETQGGSNSAVSLQDLTTGSYFVVSVDTSGMVGATANWIVERLCCNDSVWFPLANTVNVAFGNSYAEKEDDLFLFPGSQASSTEVLTMTDDAGDQYIEAVSQGSAGNEGLTGLWFQTEGCAYQNGCTP